MAAKSILQVAERVEESLSEAEGIQKNVEDGITITNQNIADATDSLSKVSTVFVVLVVYYYLRFNCYA